MRYVRLNANKAGESHFEPLTLDLNEADYRPPAPLLFVSPVTGLTVCNMSGYLRAGRATRSIHRRLNS